MFPILNPLPLPSQYHSSGSSQCTSPKHPVSCIKPGLATHFVYDIIHDSPKTSHPLLLPQSPKNCSMHLCLFCCLAYRVIVTIFLNFRYTKAFQTLLKMLNITHYQRNANQNRNEVPFHASQNGCDPKVYKQ